MSYSLLPRLGLFYEYNVTYLLNKAATLLRKPKNIYNNMFQINYHKSFQYRWVSVLCFSAFVYFRYKMSYKSVKMAECRQPQETNKKIQIKQQKYKKFLIRQSRNILEKIIFAISHILRFFHLLIIFTPTIVLLPLRFYTKTQQYWLDTFVKAVQRAGVVWIKSFQYLSHRRDIIGVQVAEKFAHLREHAPQHTFNETKKDFKAVYGKQINQVFQEFDEKPIASGSVSQVYRAKYHGKKVAVKVRHPKVDKYITRDINLLFFFSRVLSIFSKTFSIPVTQTSMKRTLNEQINFINQKQNLILFNEQFKDRKDITFPQPYQEGSSDSFLIEQFVQGVPVTYYQEQQHELRPVIARLGAQTFFDMLFKHNFIHADAHGGNIMVEIKDKSLTFFGQIWEYIKEKFYYIEGQLFQKAIESQLLKKLYQEGAEQTQKIRKMIREANQSVVITVIDAGMVITLDEQDRINFLAFLKNVIEGNGKQCARLIYSLSTFDNHKIKKDQFPNYLVDLNQLFKVIDNKDLDNLPGVELFTGLLNIIRNNQMKLQGQFATLLTNMLVLQGLAKGIWSDINILKIAIPYLNHIDKKDFQKVQNLEPRIEH